MLKTKYKLRGVSIYHGDCLEIVPKLGKFDLVFMDPPFNVGQDYSGYDDNLDDWEFSRNLFNWVSTGFESLADTGILCLHGPDSLCEMYLDVAKQRGYKRIAWVNWHYRFGQCGRGNWIDARCHCLIYAKNPDSYTWNPERVLVESDRVSYGDKRVKPAVVVNKYKVSDYDVYLGRGGKWGNPYVIGKPHPDTSEDMTRDDVCDLFEERILPNLDVSELCGKVLGCFCKPKRCHGDAIAKKANELAGITENSGKRLPGTVWGVPSDGPYWGRVPGNSKERQHDCPNQLPEVYLERIIKAYTNEGDRVLDPFGGSGTTAVVASALGRKCVTIDVSSRNTEVIRDRVKRGAIRIGE